MPLPIFSTELVPPLSVAKVARTFTTDDGGKKSFPAGHQFNCYDCHNGPNGG